MGRFQRELARAFAQQELGKKDICPYVNGIRDDDGTIKGHCFVRGKCDDAIDYRNCGTYQLMVDSK